MIVVDPGHGGANVGCEANGLVEKELTLHLALLMRELAVVVGLPLRLTRERDETVGLVARGHRAKVLAAAQVLSLHFDSNLDPAVGRLTCYCDERDRQSRELATRIIAIAPPVLTNGSRTIFVQPTGWKRRASNVVRAYQAPALLVECAFISNPRHQSFLRTSRGLSALAVGLLSALIQESQHHVRNHCNLVFR